ncbi:hypothetical protein BGW41_007867 [Actinomortierella wolfii]|nr:hypothetical protein BGW41_007867 [Actinomortierella wolfii]
MTRSLAESRDLLLGNRLGAGGYGVVHKAEWGDETVAVKRFYVTSDESNQEAIRHEIAMLDRLRHRHIIGFRGTTLIDDQLVIVMEYAENGSLRRAIDKQLLIGGWYIRRRITRQIAEALAFIHSQNILHLDLKSDNVLLSAEMEVRLCDFGLATVKRTSASKHQVAKGTLCWMAPELFQLKPEYSTKSDVYALGMVMWEMAANCTRPYQNHVHDSMITQLVMAGIREEIPPDVPSDYQALIQQCWHPFPKARPEASGIIQAMGEAEGNSWEARCRSAELSLQSGFQWNSMIERDFPNFDAMLCRRKSAETVFILGDSQFSSDTTSLQAERAPSSSKDSQEEAIVPSKSEEKVQRLSNDDKSVNSVISSNDIITTQMNLARMYEEGEEGTPKNENLAFTWYYRAANHGHPPAQYRLAKMFQEGRGTTKNDSEAFDWYLKSAEGGNVDASYAVAEFYQYGRGGVSISEERAFRWLCTAASNGHVQAQYQVGRRFLHGSGDGRGGGVQQSDTKAIVWLQRAADRKHVDAQYELGELLKRGGQGVEHDCTEAAKRLRQAADQGHAAAQLSLGRMYWSGNGVEQDDKMAARFIKLAAHQGLAEAQFSLGWFYLQGRGVKQDDAEAASWFRRAASKKHLHAQLHLGWMYEKGIGVPQDLQQASQWNTLAEQQLTGIEKARKEEYVQPIEYPMPTFFVHSL